MDKKLFSVFSIWLIALLFMAFAPIAHAQTINNVTLDPNNQFPREDITITLHVTGFQDWDDYRYFAVINYEEYNKLIQLAFVGNPNANNTNVTANLDGAGDGTIVIDEATIPRRLYKYGPAELAVVVTNEGTQLEYLTEFPGFDFPPGGMYFVDDMDFSTANFEERAVYAPMEPHDVFFAFDEGTAFEFVLTRLTDGPAINKDVRVQYRIGDGNWTNIETLNLNDFGENVGLASRTLTYYFDPDPDEGNLPPAIQTNNVALRIIQDGGEGLASGIDIWKVENFMLDGLPQEPTDYTGLFNNFFWVKNVEDLWEPGFNNFTVNEPNFFISDFNIENEDLYPGKEIKYEITAGANVEFPPNTIFEVYLRNQTTGEEILVEGIDLADFPDADESEEFSFELPFRPNSNNWRLHVRADLRDAFVSGSSALFNILPVQIFADLDTDQTPAAQKLLLDHVDHLFPGSEIHVNYFLGDDQEIDMDMVVVLEYWNIDTNEWTYLAHDDYEEDGTISAEVPTSGLDDLLQYRVRLQYPEGGEDLLSTVQRNLNHSLIDPYTTPIENELFAGSTVGFHVYAEITDEQDIIIEYKYNGQDAWEIIHDVAVESEDDHYVLHFAVDNFNVIPDGEVHIENVEFRVRWSDGAPDGGNIGLVKGYRLQKPSHQINIVSPSESVPLLYPAITMSDNLADGLYAFKDEMASVEFIVDYSRFNMPAATNLAVVLIERGGSPMIHPYLYLGSKLAGGNNGEDTQTFDILYADMEEVFGELPQLPDEAPMEFDVWIIPAEKDIEDPIMFKTEEILVDWKDNYDAQPMMITEGIDLTGLPNPLYLAYDWIVNVVPDPLNPFTMPVLEYTTDEGQNWHLIEGAFNGLQPGTQYIQLPIEEDWITVNTRFRWTQAIELGEWHVDEVKILSGEDNLVAFHYDSYGIPQPVEFVLDEEEVVVVDPCEGFEAADIHAYEFVTETTTVDAGAGFEFEWNFLRMMHEEDEGDKAIDDPHLSTDQYYVHGENHMDFNLVFGSSKAITKFTMAFPAGVVPDDAGNIHVDGNVLTPVVDGQVITWEADAGALMGMIDVMFHVAFTVETDVNEIFEIEWSIADADETIEDVLEIHPAMAFPEGTIFTFWIHDGVGYVEIAQTTQTGEHTAVIPENTLTGAYDIFVTAEYFYIDDDGVEQPCHEIPLEHIVVHEGLFVITEITPEVYEIDLKEVNFLEPDTLYYWGKDVEVKFETFGPWQDFEDLNFEVVLANIKRQHILNEGFDAGVIPANWTNLDENGDGNSWVIQQWGLGGSSAAVSYSWLGNPLFPDNWLITPQLSIADDEHHLSFWVKSQDPAWPFEQYTVLVSTTDTDPASFVPIYNETLVDDVWREITLPLADYAGEDIYIAFRHHDSTDWFAMVLDNIQVYRLDEAYMNIGNIAHVEGQNEYQHIFTLPTFEEAEDAGFEVDIAGTDFIVQVFAFQGEEEDELVLAEELIKINDFYLLGGTEQTSTPLTFDVDNTLRYAVTEKLHLEEYEGLEVYLQFTYSADIKAPHYLTLPVLQVTMDNGLTYTDVSVPGSQFADLDHPRLDYHADQKVYRYMIEEEYLTNNTRFVWYQEQPDGEWTIDDISVALITNEVPIANYFIDDPALVITIEEEIIPDFCDQFDPTALEDYIFELDDVDPVTGFEKPLYVEEEFGFQFFFDPESLKEPLPEETEFMFYLNRLSSSINKVEPFVPVDFPLVPSGSHKFDMNEVKSAPTNANALFNKDGDGDEAQWINWDNGIINNGVGLGSEGEWYGFARFEPADIAQFADFAVSRVAIGVYHMPNHADIVILQGEDIDSMEEVYRQSFTPVDNPDNPGIVGWNEVLLTQPYIFDRDLELWIGVMWGDPGAGVFPGGVDDATDHDQKGNVLILGGAVNYLSDFGIAGDWSIQAYVQPAMVPLNIDGVPYTMADAPFTGLVPDFVKTGLYEIWVQASYPEDEDGNECEFGFARLRDNILVINEASDPGDVHYMTLDRVQVEVDEDEFEPTTSLVVGQQFDAVYSTYGPWPEGVNFAAVMGSEILGVVTNTGEGVVMEKLRMPYIPFPDDVNPFNIYAYFGDELILGEALMEFDLDHFELKGYTPGEGFDQEGDRWALSPVMDLSGLDSEKTMISFFYTDISVTLSAATLPRFEVSTDGGETFTELEMLMDPNILYEVNIGDYLTESTQFRWIQTANFGEGFDVWDLSDIEITTGEDNIYFKSNTINITQLIPVIGVNQDYVWMLNQVEGMPPVIYAGQSFSYTWAPYVDANLFPEGTVFTIMLYEDDAGNVPVIDNATGEPVIFQDSPAIGLNLTATAPLVERGTYYVKVRAHYEGYVYREHVFANQPFRIFNPVIRTHIVDLDVPYAGGTASFEGTVESSAGAGLNTSYWYNLILTVGGDDWLLKAQEGSAEFDDVMLPPFVSGEHHVRIEGSIGAPLAQEGAIIDASQDMLFPDVTLADASMPGQLATHSLDDLDLTDYEAVSFDIYFSEDMANLTEAQHMILEYSIDGGQTYETIHVYPDARFNDPDYYMGDFFMERGQPLPEEAQTTNVILRFRIPETKGDVELENIAINAERPVQYAPYFALFNEINIAEQKVEILGTDALSYLGCHSVIVELEYNIRGSFGDHVELEVFANGIATGITFTGITEGSGILEVMIVDSWPEVQFSLNAFDPSFFNLIGDNIEVVGYPSDVVTIEVVPFINENTDVAALNAYSCEAVERFMVVANPQDFFMYQARNAETHALLGEPVVYHPHMGWPLEIPIGVVDSKIKAEVVVTAMSSDGLHECQTLVLDEIVVFDVRNYVLQYRVDAEIGGIWKDYTGAEEFVICEDIIGALELRVFNISEQAPVDADIRWYRDNMETPLQAGFFLNRFPLTGNYFAVITDQFCDDFVSMEVFVTVEEAPEIPIIVFEGEYELCEGETAMLYTSDDYGYYRWYRNGNPIQGNNQSSLVIYEGGDYEVEVSNHPFDPYGPNCTTFSDVFGLDLEVYTKPNIPAYTVNPDDLVLCEPGVVRVRVFNPEPDVMYQLFDVHTGEHTGVARLGMSDPLVLTSDVLESDAKLGIIASRIGNHVCDLVNIDTDAAIAIRVYELTIAVSGNTLVASLAFPEAISYQWYRNGSMILHGGNDRMLSIYDDAEYTVVVETREGCILEASIIFDKFDEIPGDDQETTALVMYPNPAKDEVTMLYSSEFEEELQVRILNLNGEVVFNHTLSKSEGEVEYTIPIDHLNNGSYIIQVVGQYQVTVQQFIKF